MNKLTTITKPNRINMQYQAFIYYPILFYYNLTRNIFQHLEVFISKHLFFFEHQSRIIISQQMSELNSQDHSVIISEDLPVVQSDEEKSFQNRLSKFVNKVGQHQWISQFDLFSIPLKLNYNGEDTFKTEFGGIVYLFISLLCIILAIIYKLPEGLALKSPITMYSLVQDDGNSATVFDNSESFFKLYFYDPITKKNCVGGESQFFTKKVSLFQDINGVPKKLQMIQNLQTGEFFFNNTQKNSGATIYGTEASNRGAIHLQVANCDMMDSDPVYGACFDYLMKYAMIIQVTNFAQTTGKVIPKMDKVVLTPGLQQLINVDKNKYTTNNNFLGYIANILSYQISYYNVIPQSFSSGSAVQFDSTMNCFNMDTFVGNTCSTIEFVFSGTTNIVTQMFDDITSPILFFLSTSQIFFYIAYLCFLRNYSNNSLKLRIADSLVYITQPNGRHYNFKEGFSVFMACLLHKHYMMEVFDMILYHFCEASTKKFLPLKMQLTMDMINYGEKCLNEKQFFGQINEIYSQQNVQPSKIIVNVQNDDQKEEQKQVEEPDFYFEREVQEQAFKRMCFEHEYYSPERKIHLRNLLKETDKRFKLVLSAQQIFEKYKRQVESQSHTKQFQVPLNYAQSDELSSHAMKKQFFG